MKKTKTAIMKNTYLQPSAEMENMEVESFICSSQVVTSENGITYGGVDENGTLDPASRKYHDEWEENEDEY